MGRTARTRDVWAYGEDDHMLQRRLDPHHHDYCADTIHGATHHHHGPGDGDVIIHKHIDSIDGHNHIVTHHDHIAGTVVYHYGPADHDHGTSDHQ